MNIHSSAVLVDPGAAWLAKPFGKDVYSCNWCLYSPFVLRDWARTSVVLIYQQNQLLHSCCQLGYLEQTKPSSVNGVSSWQEKSPPSLDAWQCDLSTPEVQQINFSFFVITLAMHR